AWVWRTCGSEADAEGEPRHVEAERRGDVVLVVLAGQIAERQRDREAAQPGGHHCARQDSPGIPLDPGPTFLGVQPVAAEGAQLERADRGEPNGQSAARQSRRVVAARTDHPQRKDGSAAVSELEETTA